MVIMQLKTNCEDYKLKHNLRDRHRLHNLNTPVPNHVHGNLQGNVILFS